MTSRLRRWLRHFKAESETPSGNFALTDHIPDSSSQTPYNVSNSNLVSLPHIYRLARLLALHHGCTHIIALGCGHANGLAELSPGFKVMGVDYAENVHYCRRHYPSGQWIEHDLDSPAPIRILPEVLRSSVIICPNLIEQLARPEYILFNLRQMLDHAPLALLTTPERESLHSDDIGSPPVSHHVRKWTSQELDNLLGRAGLQQSFAGLTVDDNQSDRKTTRLAILANNNIDSRPVKGKTPDDFRVIAFMRVFNEADIIAPALERLINNGIEVYLLDNWSTDDTVAIAKTYLNRGLLHIEHCPDGGPSSSFDFIGIFHRIEALSASLEANWFMLHDADEFRQSPWPDIPMRDALYYVDSLGYNCIDFALIKFPPTDNDFAPGTDFVQHFQHWKVETLKSRHQAWKKQKGQISLAAKAGHHAVFPGRRVFPYRFLLRHYPLRSQAHAEKKIFEERLARWSKYERETLGWHRHYDHYVQGQNFLEPMDNVQHFDEGSFPTQFLVERLTGIGWGDKDDDL